MRGWRGKRYRTTQFKEACSPQSHLAFFLVFLKQPNAQFLLENMRPVSVLGRGTVSASMTKETGRKELEKQKY